MVPTSLDIEATSQPKLMLPGKIKRGDSASHLALNLEMTQKEAGQEKEGPPAVVRKITECHKDWHPDGLPCPAARKPPIFPPEP